MVNALVRTFLKAPVLALLLAGVLIVWGWQAFIDNPKDVIPDIADNQTIVFTKWMGRSPKDVDEQVTYPLTVALQGVPGVREIRATSGFGWSTVYVIFHDDIDFYWARSRVLEKLNVAQSELPDGVVPMLGPDATALGQIFWYTVENGWYALDQPGIRIQDNESSDPGLRFSQVSLDELRSIQDFDVKLALEGVEGVSEVASIGGYVRQYQIDVNPEALRAFDVSLSDLVKAVRSSNVDVGAKVIEQNGMEVLVRGIGFLGGQTAGLNRMEREQATMTDIENIVVKAANGTPIYMRQLADIATGPDFRRGALDKMGAEAVGGCVIMRYGENPLTVIERIKEKIAAIEPGLPPGVRIDAFYDRSVLIGDTMATLGTALWQELVITVIAVVLFLLHFRSSLVVAVTLPLAVLAAFICMQALSLPSNIMSLAGIAIAVGTMVDMGIVMTENIYQHLTNRRSEYMHVETDPTTGRQRDVVDHSKRLDLIQEAASEVGGAILTAVATTVISFMPVFFLEGQAAKMFTPLAWTKTFCLIGAVLMALVVVPPLASVMLRAQRISRRRAALTAAPLALLAGLTWSMAAQRSDAFLDVVQAIRSYLHLPSPWDAMVLGIVTFVVTYLVIRERIKPLADNPLSCFIHWVYKPTLRWILHHKLTFAALPSALVLWGMGIWLGWGPIIELLLAVPRWVGLDIAQWSLAWWVHLGLGLFGGLVLVPLLVDTLRAVRGIALPDPAHRTALSKLAWAGLAIGLAVLMQTFDVAQYGSKAVAAIFAQPPIDATTGQPTPLKQFAPLAGFIEQSKGIGQEFMPPLDEGDFLYMPSILPAGSINTVMEVMQKQDVRFARLPEVANVVGKLGRIESALDPAPVGMLETVISLKPRDEWPLIEDPDHPGRMRRRTMNEIWKTIQDAGRFPGVLPSVQLQPIRTRVEMLSTGLNAKIGLKVYGSDMARCEALAVDIEQLLRSKLDNAEAVNAIRTNGKPYLEFHIDREAIARYGVNITDVQDVIEVAIGGKNLTTTFEGLDRYPVRIRYQRELRDDIPDLERILIPTPSGAQIPISLVADIISVVGPMSVRREGARYVSYVTMNNVGIDETTLVERGQSILQRAVHDGTLDVPDGYYFKWTGSYERNLRAKKRLTVLVPLVLLINFVLIYLQFKRFSLAAVVFMAIPVAFSGGFILLNYWPDIHNALYLAGLMDRGFEGQAMYLTVAVWVGFIALFGIAVDDGIVIGTYLDQTFGRSKIQEYQQIEERVVEAGLRRIRPCLMTTFTTLCALVPVMLSTGKGSDVMVPMAIPVFGGMTLALISLFVVPTSYCAIKQIKWRLGLPDPDFIAPAERG